MYQKSIYLFLIIISLCSCKKSKTTQPVDTIPTPSTYFFSDLKVNGTFSGFNYYGLNNTPVVKITFSAPINQSSITANISLADASGNAVSYTSLLENNDNTVVITPTALQPLTKYTLNVNTGLLSKSNNKLQTVITVNLFTAVDETDKFARITDDELLTLVQRQTFKYFWDFGHPTSGLARERNTGRSG